MNPPGIEGAAAAWKPGRCTHTRFRRVTHDATLSLADVVRQVTTSAPSFCSARDSCKSLEH